MKSIDKLKRLTGETSVPEGKIQRQTVSLPPEKYTQLEELRRRIDYVVARIDGQNRGRKEQAALKGNRGLAEILDGQEIENQFGRFFLAESSLSGNGRHGCRYIGDSLDLDMTTAGMLANNPALGEFSPSDALFLDTETTGLAGGTGTMAFLIGLGWFEDGHFQIRQILARDFSEEKAALAYLREKTARKKFLVTFNGKTFDVNLLATRFVMNRLSSDIEMLPHLDLLHPSRRLLGRRLENCRLATLEADVLGVRREGDVPGWEIPQRYFEWLRKRDPRLLSGIFEHNRLDVISMATLTAHLIDLLNAQTAAPFAHAEDYLAAAHLLLQRDQPDAAEKILAIFQKDSCPALSLPAKKQLSRLYKRTGKMADAALLWEQLTSCEPTDFYAVSELAKYLEHRLRDYSKTKNLLEEALSGAGRFSLREQNSLEHRLKRVCAKFLNNKHFLSR